MSNELLRQLRQAGFDVVLPRDIGLRGASDDDALAYAADAGRVFITDDADFLRMHRQSQSHAGIAFCGPRLRNPGQIVRALRRLASETTPDEIRGRLIYLTNVLRALDDEADDRDP